MERSDSEFMVKPRKYDRRIADDGCFCLSEHGVKQLDRGKGRPLVLVMETERLVRSFHDVEIDGGFYLADSETGSLYCPLTGRSLSGSPLRVERGNV